MRGYQRLKYPPSAKMPKTNRYANYFDIHLSPFNIVLKFGLIAYLSQSV